MSRSNSTLVWIVSGVLLLGALIEDGQGAGGISGSGAIRGKLQRFASIVVNDVELDTTLSEVTVNGRASTVAMLRVGHQVDVVSAAIELGHADSITYFSSVWGPIQAIDPIAETFRVLGQEVATSAVTNFANVDLVDLAVGDWVEVSGVRSNVNSVLATFVRRTQSATRVRLTGVLQRISGAGTLRVAGVDVATTESQRAGLEVGETLSVRGFLNATGTGISASRIYRVGGPPVAATNLSVEGVLTRATASRIVVAGQRFRFTAATAFVNGTQASLAPGVRLHVEANRTATDVFATAVVFKPTRDVRVEGVLEEVELLTSDSARIRVSGLPLVITQGTDYGHSSSPEYNLGGVQDLVVGDYLKVRGYVDGREGAVTRVDRTPFKDRTRLTALVSRTTADGFELLGNAIVFDANTTFKVGGDEVGASQFLDAVRVGDFVEVLYEGTWSPGMAAESIAIVAED